MPGYRKHLLFGTVVFVALASILYSSHCSLEIMSEWFVCTMAGALFPDVDIKSKGQKYFYRLLFVSIGILFLMSHYSVVVMLVLFSMFPLLVRHRGIFHDPLFIGFCVLVVWYIVSIYYPLMTRPLGYNLLFFLMGAYSHIILDGGWRIFLRI